jgi:hypothetical protein
VFSAFGREWLLPGTGSIDQASERIQELRRAPPPGSTLAGWR